MLDKNITKNIKRFEKFAEIYILSLDIQSPKIKSAIAYSLLKAGKRVRAMFVYEVAKMCNLELGKADVIALAVECIHAYSLIHDDLPAMDNSYMRRGKPANHIKFGEATAILVGDALNTLAFEVIADIDIASYGRFQKILKTLSACAGAMVAGQQLDLNAENQLLNLEELNKVHHNKTGKMFEAAIMLPFYASDFYQDIALKQILISFAQDVGLSFQIKDDILDVTSTTDILGKKSNNDVTLNKSTFPSLLGLEASKTQLENLKIKMQSLVDDFKKYNLDAINLVKISNYVIERDF